MTINFRDHNAEAAFRVRNETEEGYQADPNPNKTADPADLEAPDGTRRLSLTQYSIEARRGSLDARRGSLDARRGSLDAPYAGLQEASKYMSALGRDLSEKDLNR